MSDTPETPAPSGAPEAPLQPGTGAPSESNKTKVWLAIGAIVVVGLGGFFGARALSGNSKKAGASNTLPPTSTGTGSNNGGTGNRTGNGGFLRGNRGTTGKITALASPNFTVQSVTITGGGPESGTRPTTSNGPLVTVKTSSSTSYTVTKAVALSAIAKGDRVIATGTQGSSGITATSITDMGTASANGGQNGNGFGGGGFRGGNGNGSTPPGAGGGFGGGQGGANANGRSFAFGTVASVSGNTIVVTTANGTSTVTVGSGATITKTESGSFSDLKVGDTVVVTGTKSGNTVTATDVRTGTGSGAGGFGGFGGFGGGGRGRFGGGASNGQAGS
ncbi:MAG TPA: DUF5666 domain-containing protein [Acidimicrobiia bacterium]|jgi:hypothetical protein